MTHTFVKRQEMLPFTRPVIGEDEINEVVDTLKSGWLTTGPKSRQFETDFAQSVKAESALALASCTAALHLALKVLDVQPGDEVITSGLTFVAAANVIEHVGAIPILVDVEPDTLNLDVRLVAEAINPKTKAIIPVHFAGHACQMRELQDVSVRTGVPIIEDAAHALGARYTGAPIGSSGNLVAFSFHATKNFTTGEGGMLVGPKTLIDRARVLSLFGITRDAYERYSSKGGGFWHYDCVSPGFKNNMSDIAASIGIHQLKRLPEFQKRRTQIAQVYSEAFAESEALEVPHESSAVTHSWHLYPLRLRLDRIAIDRGRFISEMQNRNIACSVHFIPIHHHSYFKHHTVISRNTPTVMDAEFDRILSIPINPSMSDDDVQDVIAAVKDVVKTFSR